MKIAEKEGKTDQCWERDEHRAPPESTPPCAWEADDFDKLRRGMGFHQLSIRWLTWLLLNHLQLAIVSVVNRSFRPKSDSQLKKEDSADDSQRDMQARVLFSDLWAESNEADPEVIYQKLRDFKNESAPGSMQLQPKGTMGPWDITELCEQV